MAFLGDYHTHTTYSRKGKKLHAVGSVRDNVRAACQAGLKEIAITDHAFKHLYGIESENAFAELKAECAAAEKEFGIAVYVGLENNLDYRSGKNAAFLPFVDCPHAFLSNLQIVQGGYHAMVGTPTIFKNMLFWARNVIFKFLPSKKLIARNTAAYKRMIDEYPIDFIGHLNRGILADAVEVAKYAHERGVYIELNGRHKSLSKKQIIQMVQAGVQFVCNSDAHNPNSVGKMPCAEKLIKDCKIPYSQIANWDRLPDFRSKNFCAARQSKSAASDDTAAVAPDCDGEQ